MIPLNQETINNQDIKEEYFKKVKYSYNSFMIKYGAVFYIFENGINTDHIMKGYSVGSGNITDLLVKHLNNQGNNCTKTDIEKDCLISFKKWVTQPFDQMKQYYIKIKRLTEDSVKELNKKGVSGNKLGEIHDKYLKQTGNTTITGICEGNSYFKLFHLIKPLFNRYDTVRSEINKWIVEKTGAFVCPYCNIQYTYTRGTRATAQLDHFFPRSEYPMFAICYSNLIPSCGSCNGIKSDDDNDLVSPYQKDAFNDLVISAELKNCNIYSSDSYEIKLNTSDPDTKNNIDVFKLKEAYNMHTDYAKEIYIKSYIYKNHDSQELIKNSFKGFGITANEIRNFYLGNYIDTEDRKKRSLAKLTGDLFRQIYEADDDI